MRHIVHSPIGKLGITVKNDLITEVAFISEETSNHTGDRAPDIQQAFTAYFSAPAYQFNLPLQPAGTPFQQKVWQALRAIPYGQTVTYGELAKQLHTSPRAVGQACRKNPLPVIIPCHRVVGAANDGGFLGATEGAGMKIKQWLLSHEKSMILGA